MGPIVGCAVLACLLLLPCAASAIDEIATEEYVADLMATPRPAEPKSVETRSWAVLPEVGFGPDTGPLVGGKFTDRDVAGSGVTLDAEATQALERQQMLSLTAGTPHLADDRFLALFEARFSGFIFGPQRDIPFWELEDLGGDDTLRGFFPHRFLGVSRVLLSGEYRFKLTQFDFLDWWHVRLDGVAFGEAGRVFIGNDELRREFRLNDTIIRRIASTFRYSYGGGLRVALSAALVARIDVGFSDEERGLVYLEFGQTF